MFVYKIENTRDVLLGKLITSTLKAFLARIGTNTINDVAREWQLPNAEKSGYLCIVQNSSNI
jgi:hypothetical protein